MGKISVVINTLNEETNLPRLLASVKDWVYEIVVVDMHSKDGTVDIAKKAGARVFSHRKTGYVEPARNYAISKVKGDWVLLLDADEEVPVSLAKKLREIANSSEASYYAVPRKNIVFGKWMKHSRWWPDYNIRFFKKGAVEWVAEIHSVPLTQGKGADLSSTREDFAIVHHNYNSVEQFITRMNRYTSIQANELKKAGKKYSWKSLLKKPTAEFVSRFFAGQGYKDGVHGLALALLQSLSELVVEVKLWELSRFPEQDLEISQLNNALKQSQKEINYWTADTLVNENGGFINRVKRKFKLQ